MKKQAFYKKGIGIPLHQDENNNLVYSDTPLNQNGNPDPKSGLLDPLRGEGPDYKTGTDPMDFTGKTKIKIDGSGRSFEDAYNWSKAQGLIPDGETLEQYTDFSIKQKAEYKKSGIWRPRDWEGWGNETTTSSSGDSGDTFKPIQLDEVTVTAPAPEKPSSTFGKITAEEVNIPDSFGMLRRRDGKGGFKQGFGAHADQAVGQAGKEGRIARKNLKKEDLAGGLTRQEARWRKTMGKAIAAAQGSGTNVWYEGEDGKITSIADTSGPTNQQSLNRGKGRRKAQRMVKRANRIEKRMKRRGGWQKAEYDRNQ